MTEAKECSWLGDGKEHREHHRLLHKALERWELQRALANEKIRELEAELAQRNNGECFGPFHGGFICADCARLTRDLQARAEKAAELNKELYDSREEAKARAETAEGFLDCKNEPCAIVGGWCLRHAKARVAELRAALDEYEANQNPREDTFNQERARRVGDETPSQGVHEREDSR